LADIIAAKKEEDRIRQSGRELRQVLDLTPQHVAGWCHAKAITSHLESRTDSPPNDSVLEQRFFE
jgi:hypothetical protein